ncbi:unnamed protein product [Brassica napus]|uniref:(rape) hypothetical protein n=1 Tax=Brassica napus TaxID=3708 RepID=A0A816S8F0_BRANA|nr:unnamed protein product [Brassica napus]
MRSVTLKQEYIKEWHEESFDFCLYIPLENSKDETKSALVLRGARKASKKTSSRPANKRYGCRVNKTSACNMKYSDEWAPSRPPKASDGLINQAYAVEEFAMGGQNDSDSD